MISRTIRPRAKGGPRAAALSFAFILLAACALLPASCASRAEGNGGPVGTPADKRDKPSDEVASSRDRDKAGATSDLRVIPEDESAPRAAPDGKAGSAGRASGPSSSGLRAGFSDDNEGFNYFLSFLEKYASTPHCDLSIGERIAVTVKDSVGKGVANAAWSLSEPGGKVLSSGLSYADGLFYLFPADYGSTVSKYSLTLSNGKESRKLEVDRKGPRALEIKLQSVRAVPSPVPLDIAFVLDTTGSMGEEINRLKSFIEIIYRNLAETKPKPLLRFSLVLYKDRGDEYVTRVVPFTADLDSFAAELDKVTAGGGGDEPEDLQSALQNAIQGLAWAPGGVRLAFVVTDAPPHLDYGQDYTYARAAREAKAKGIRLHTIGTGSLNLAGEYVLRQLSQYTQGRYIFLTYGEAGESEGGKEGSVSHHTGANYQSESLESIIIKFAREDLSRFTDLEPSKDEDYFSATKAEGEERDATVRQLFTQAFQSLYDYSSLRITQEAKLAILPVQAMGSEDERKALGPRAEYLTSQLELFAAQSKTFTYVTRNAQDLDRILREQALSLSGIAEGEEATALGKLLAVDALVIGQLYKKADRYELYLKLVRVETGEVLSVSKARIDFKLLD
jgi:Mg-chelatase subunit ChlD